MIAVSRITPENFEVYQFYECTKFPSTVTCSGVEAMQAVQEGRAKRVHRHKIVLAKPQPPEPKERKVFNRSGRAFGLSAAPDAKLIERHLLAVNSDQDDIAIVATLAWTGEVLSGNVLDRSHRKSGVA